jgi:N-acetylneuraminic acid mutarotase
MRYYIVSNKYYKPIYPKNMKKFIMSLAILVALQSCEKDSALDVTGVQSSHDKEISTIGFWKRLADYRGSRLHSSGFSIGNKGYIGLGFFREPLSGFMEYDPASNSWSQIADFGGGKRNDAAGFALNGKGYIFGGSSELGSNRSFSDLWEYDPYLNSWTKKPGVPGKGRIHPFGFSVGSFGYAGGGLVLDTLLVNNCITINSRFSRDLFQYDPSSNKWSKKLAFPGDERIESVTFSIGDKGYLGTGEAVGFVTYKNDFWEYDPTYDKWTRKADVPGRPRTEASGFSISSLNRGYIGFGIGSQTGSENNFWEYNPEDDKWRERAIPNMVGYFKQAVGFSIGKKGYVGPGGINDVETQFWEFDPLAK